jgi:uncharacterized membrane protein YoaK (UPF0700 family)
MNVNLWEFVTIFILVFALCMAVAGIFTAYFGSGKSRKIGIVLLVLGLVIGLIWFMLSSWIFVPILGTSAPTIPIVFQEVVVQSALVIIAAIIGALAAVGLFLVAIMKS